MEDTNSHFMKSQLSERIVSGGSAWHKDHTKCYYNWSADSQVERWKKTRKHGDLNNPTVSSRKECRFKIVFISARNMYIVYLSCNAMQFGGTYSYYQLVCRSTGILLPRKQKPSAYKYLKKLKGW
jgi:hypothetical protein